jgi:hypothetical protein
MTDSITPPPKPPRQSSPILRAAITLGVVILVVVMLIPVALVALNGPSLGRMMMRFSNSDERLRIAESTRAFTLRKDSSISIARAEAAFNALQPPPQRPTKFSFKPRIAPPLPPWVEDSLPPELFPGAHSHVFAGPDPITILKIASTGVTRDELDYLERLAHAPVWRDVDLLARAPAIDFIEAMLVLPPPDSATADELPTVRFAAMKELVYASVSRAAYYLAAHRKDSAELALRTIPSLGFLLMDHATSAIDQLIGGVIVGIGRDALLKFYAITNNPLGGELKSRADSIIALPPLPRGPGPVDKAGLIAGVRSDATPRGMRFEMLRHLAMMPCMTVRGLLLGTTRDVDDTFAWAKEHLARHPGEVAEIDLISRLLDHDLTPNVDNSSGGGFAVGAAAVAGAITRNPRFVSCTSIMAMIPHAD